MLGASEGQYLTISWETVVAIVGPIVAAGVWMAKWMASRSDKDRDELLRRMDADRADATEDRKILKETMHALRNAVQVASGDGEIVVAKLSEITHSQQRITWAQERILAIIEADLRKIDRLKETP
jgi:hypothetical protein